MNTPVVTDVFKFLAVRPAQRITEKETARTMIRDKRAATRDGKHELAELARRLSPSGAALAHWKELDLATIEFLFEGYRALLRSYEAITPGKSAPPASTMLKDAGLSSVKDGSDPKLTHLAWEALYTAHATGRHAGVLLEKPMAALRVLHFAQIFSNEPQTEPAAALEALRATVVIPTSFDESFHPAPSAPDAVAAPGQGTSSSSSPSFDAPRRTAQIRSLATELNATQELVDSITSAPVALNAAARSLQADSASGFSAKFALSTVPLLSDVLPAYMSREQAAVLDQLRIADTTSVPVAALMLQSHLEKLSDRASVLVDDPEFQAALAELALMLPANIAPILAKQVAPVLAPDVDVSGLITPLGIGDLKVVKQTLLSYVAGEVAHIENVLKGESKERTHRNLDRTETTIFTSEEVTKDNERDTQSTDRFELKREAAQSVKEDMSIKAGLTVTATYGPVVATATGDFAYSTSKEESEKNSSNFAREVIDRSVTKVQTKTRSERTTKTLNEVEEINRHSLNNGPPSDAHVTGIYRWVDKRYRAQVYNYGARLLLEFVVPEPAAFYRATHAPQAVKVNATPPPPFLRDPGLGRSVRPPLTAPDITESNYLRYAARYGTAGIVPPPPLFTYISVAIAPKEGLGKEKAFSFSTKDFVVPAGYILNSYSVALSVLWVNHPQFNLQVRGDVWEIQNTNGQGGMPILKKLIGDPGTDNAHVTGNVAVSVPVSVVCYDIEAFAIDLQGLCRRTDDAMTAWCVDTFGKIQTAYQALQTAYDQKVTQAQSAAGIPIEGQNPGLNRLVEKNELKKLCITMMTGQHFKQFGAMTEPPDDAAHPPEMDVFEALAEGPILQFFEQAFEWEQLTYLYYPYFWGRKKNWVKVSNISDPDPLFQQFLTAGAARVVIPVPLAYVNDVLYLLQNPMKETELAKKVWAGGGRPIIGSVLYESIAEELKQRTDDLAGATPEGEPWEFALPTTLVWLQPDDKLPTFP